MSKKTLTGITANYADNILKKPQHILICGATGAGKSTVEFTLINSMLFLQDTPALMLIDPKRIDLNKYRKMRNVIRYADEVNGAMEILNDAVDIIERRYKIMQKKDTEICNDKVVYIIIDELADLVLIDKNIFKPLQRILAKGRACNVFVLMSTQIVNREVLPTLLRGNVNTVICLHCENANVSRLIIGRAGAEMLPAHGKVYIKDVNGVRVENIPFIERDELQRVIDFWKK